MFKVGDQVKINPDMKCEAIKKSLGLNDARDLDRVFEVLSIDPTSASVGAKKEGYKEFSYQGFVWVTIKLPDGESKKIGSIWLTAVSE